MKVIGWLRKYREKEMEKRARALATTEAHTQLIRSKPYLKWLYSDLYRELGESWNCDVRSKIVVEIGSGGGFIKDIMDGVITSDVIETPGVDLVFSAMELPFRSGSLDGIVMLDVLHHLWDPAAFFAETARCLKLGGRLVCVEPACTLLASLIWQYFHHEPFDKRCGWQLQRLGPLCSANSALPWIIFCRDRKRFLNEFPMFGIRGWKVHTPFRYLVSGGLSLRQLLPTWTYGCVKRLELVLSPLNSLLGMFVTITVEKAR